MSAKTNLVNKNLMQNSNFCLILSKLPDVAYFTKEIEIPGLSLPVAIQPTPFVDIPVPGDHIDFEQFTITFNVDEDMANYKALFRWMNALGFPRDRQQYSGDISDAMVYVATSKFNNNPKTLMSFQSIWPTSISSIPLTIENATVTYATCTVSFAYTLFDFVD